MPSPRKRSWSADTQEARWRAIAGDSTLHAAVVSSDVDAVLDLLKKRGSVASTGVDAVIPLTRTVELHKQEQGASGSDDDDGHKKRPW